MIDEGLKRARYSEVERRLWNDARFRRLSPIPPCGQGLWLYLLTTPELGAIPGLIVMGESAMAEHLNWPIEAFRDAFEEVFAEGMVEADWKARLVVTLKAIRKHRPNSPNVVISWRQQWLEVPDSPLKLKFYHKLKAFVEGLGKGYADAFAKVIANPSPNQDQDQDQDQEQEQKRASARNGQTAAASVREPDPDPNHALDAIQAELTRWPSCQAVATPDVAAMLERRFRTIEISKGAKLEWVLVAIGEAASDGVGLNAEALTRKLRSYCDNAKAPRASANGGHVSDTPKTYESPHMSKAEVAAQKARATAKLDALEAKLRPKGKS
jgi:hypothetical protein